MYEMDATEQLPMNPYAEQEKAKAEEQKQRVIDAVKESISAQKEYCIINERLGFLSRTMLLKKGYVSFSKAYRDDDLKLKWRTYIELVKGSSEGERTSIVS